VVQGQALELAERVGRGEMQEPEMEQGLAELVALEALGDPRPQEEEEAMEA